MAELTIKARDWRLRLRAARRFLRLTQAQLAARANVATETVRAYETGRRSPKDRTVLLRVLNAAELSRIETNEILAHLGFAPITDWSIPETERTWEGLDEAQKLCDDYPWPVFAVNERIDVVAANAAFQALFGVDLNREFTDPLDRNLLMLASNPRFADHVENWDEAVGVLIAVWKGHFAQPASIDQSTPLFGEILERFAAGDPRYVSRFSRLWEDAKLIRPVRRWNYRIAWRDNDHGLLNFLCLSNTGDDPRTLVTFCDWIPVDAQTWMRLEAIKAASLSAGSQVTVAHNRAP